jgi:elongation factor Ts
MSPISASAIQSLRARTGVSITACKEALEESGGDEEKAIELLRKRGIAQAAKKASRAQAEGLIFQKTQGSVCAMFALRCETDFVARDENFLQAGEQISTVLLSDGIEAAQALSAQLLPDLVQKLGENITADEMHRIEAPVLGGYLHSNQRIGVIIGLDGATEEVARDIAMHAAALSPRYIHPEEVGADVLEKEREIWREHLKKDGKPEEMWDKIMLGKEKKFREENAITKQAFVKDPSKTVEQHLSDAKITTYVRISIG